MSPVSRTLILSGFWLTFSAFVYSAQGPDSAPPPPAAPVSDSSMPTSPTNAAPSNAPAPVPGRPGEGSTAPSSGGIPSSTPAAPDAAAPSTNAPPPIEANPNVPLSQQPAVSKAPAALDIHALPEEGNLSGDVMKKQLAKAVDTFLARESQGGVFVIGDDQLGKFWKLKRVHATEDNYVRLEPNEDVATVAFRSVEDSTPLDLDFYVTRTDDGWTVRDVRIGRVAKQPRYYLKGTPIP